jgi:hypothetical protein
LKKSKKGCSKKIFFFAMPSAFMGRELAICFHGQKVGALLSWAENWHFVFMGRKLAPCFHGQRTGTLFSWAET